MTSTIGNNDAGIAAAAQNAQADLGVTAGLDPQLAAAVQKLVQAGQGRLVVASGLRTPEQQQALFDRAKSLYGSDAAARNFVAQPGSSNHETGNAVDLMGDFSVIQQLAPRYGLYAPMPYEPWHVELASQLHTSSPNSYSLPPVGGTFPSVSTARNDPAYQAASLGEAMSLATPTQGQTNSNAQFSGQFNPATPVLTSQFSDIMGGDQGTGQGGQMGSSTNTNGGGTVSYSGGKGDVTPNDLYAKLSAQGLPPAAAAALVSIAGRESGFRANAHNDNASTGDNSYGLFQVNLLNGGWGPYLQQHGIADPAAALQTVDGSVAAAKLLYDSSGLNPWGGYKGEPWYHGTDPNVGVQASGGAVTLPQVMGLPNG